jgi:hypothetical protein
VIETWAYRLLCTDLSCCQEHLSCVRVLYEIVFLKTRKASSVENDQSTKKVLTQLRDLGWEIAITVTDNPKFKLLVVYQDPDSALPKYRHCTSADNMYQFLSKLLYNNRLLVREQTLSEAKRKKESDFKAESGAHYIDTPWW